MITGTRGRLEMIKDITKVKMAETIARMIDIEVKDIGGNTEIKESMMIAR